MYIYIHTLWDIQLENYNIKISFIQNDKYIHHVV